MPNEKNHLYTPDDEKRDRKNANKRKEQQQFSRFSTALATSVNNANLLAASPALQRETKPQIGDPYDDSKGSVSTNQVIDFTTFGSNYTFFVVTANVAFTFDNLPTGRHIMFVVDILVDNPGGVTITFPQVTNPPIIVGSDNERLVLEFVGVVRSDPTGQVPPVETYTFISGVATSDIAFPIIWPRADQTPGIAATATVDLSLTTGNANVIQFHFLIHPVVFLLKRLM